jgi:flagellar biosynthesis chaperone FliJ
MKARRERVERLLTLRERAVESARAVLGAALRVTAQAAEAQAAAENAWSTRAAAAATTRFPDVDALMESHAHLDALRRRADLAATELTAARDKEEVARAGCMRAERERKKLELWRDRLLSLEAQAERRSERLATDEVAARTFVRTHA